MKKIASLISKLLFVCALCVVGSLGAMDDNDPDDFGAWLGKLKDPEELIGEIIGKKPKKLIEPTKIITLPPKEQEPSELTALKKAIDEDNFPAIWEKTVDEKTKEHNALWKRKKQDIVKYVIEHLNKTIETGDVQKVSNILKNSPYIFAELVTHVPMDKHPFNVVLISSLKEAGKISMLKELIPYFSLDTILDKDSKDTLLTYIAIMQDLDFVKWVVEEKGAFKNINTIPIDFFGAMAPEKNLNYLEKMQKLYPYIKATVEYGQASANLKFPDFANQLDQEEIQAYNNICKNIMLEAIKNNDIVIINNIFSPVLWKMYKKIFEQAIINKLYYAIYAGDFGLLKTMLTQKTSYKISDFINNPDYNKMPILSYVFPINIDAKIKAAMVESLINNGKADPNASDLDGNTPLHVASALPHTTVINDSPMKVLLENGAVLSATAKNNQGQKPIDLVTNFKNPNAATLLEEAEQIYTELIKKNGPPKPVNLLEEAEQIYKLIKKYEFPSPFLNKSAITTAQNIRDTLGLTMKKKKEEERKKMGDELYDKLNKREMLFNAVDKDLFEEEKNLLTKHKDILMSPLDKEKYETKKLDQLKRVMQYEDKEPLKKSVSSITTTFAEKNKNLLLFAIDLAKNEHSADMNIKILYQYLPDALFTQESLTTITEQAGKKNYQNLKKRLLDKFKNIKLQPTESNIPAFKITDPSLLKQLVKATEQKK